MFEVNSLWICFLYPQYFQCKGKLPQTPKSTSSVAKQTSGQGSQRTSTGSSMEDREEEGREKEEREEEEGEEEKTKEEGREVEGREETEMEGPKRKRRVSEVQMYDFTWPPQHDNWAVTS